MRRTIASSCLQVNYSPNCCPRCILQKPGSISERSVAARIVGGNFYDFFRYPGKAISAEAVGDVSGKGAAAYSS